MSRAIQTTNTMKTKWMSKAMAVGALVSAVFGASAQTQSADALINKLVQKGVLTEQEAKDIKTEMEKENQEAKTSPFVLPLGKEAKLKLGGFVQANGEFGDVASQFGTFSDNPLVTANHTPLHSRFFLRRARINVSGEFLEN